LWPAKIIVKVSDITFEKVIYQQAVTLESARTRNRQGCQIFLDKTYQNRKNIPNYHKLYLCNVPKLFPMPVK
jgi:hypothetical protein